MKDIQLDPTHQLVIVTRLAEFCRYHGAIRYHQTDPWTFMREKLLQTEEAIDNLKSELLAVTKAKLIREMKAGAMTEERYSDYKGLLERLLSRGDFADVAVHLTNIGGGPGVGWIEQILSPMQATHLFIEEDRPTAERNPSWDKLVDEISKRLELDKLGFLLARKKKTARRRQFILRRVRRNVAEYCSVVHIPTDPTQTFTPFMLPRIEAVIAANLRFLTKYR